jgi:amidophosphoribosyltransferase
VDDSIIRGTTCQQIIQMARDAGARRVYFASAAPPVRYPNVYGIDMPAAREFVAFDRSVDEICTHIGADWLVYQDLDDLEACIRELNPEIEGLEASVFDGRYVTGDVDAEYLANLSAQRSDAARVARDQLMLHLERGVLTD